ncbi:hypothetical protein ACH4GK_31630 [Streptomyces rimosus]|uniref:hypothetical protein n=1 Tax=Streptomyces rimosus TaxID=1927 RepID=UPI000ADA4363|nr:hypothetical protein [Streptomyces rimosus]
MPDQPAPQPAEPRVDETAGDLGSLVRLGLVEPPPVPSPEPPPPPTETLDATVT